jgi:hypothetical protein
VAETATVKANLYILETFAMQTIDLPKKPRSSIFLSSCFELRLIAKGMIVGILVYTATKRGNKLPLKDFVVNKVINT